MGIGLADMDYLSQRGHLARPGALILDIGSQNLYNATPGGIRDFVLRHGRIADAAAFEREAQRLAYFSTPRPGERTSYLSELLDLTDIAYTSYDVCPALKTEIFDLNTDTLPAHYREHFDVVLNFGTTEHLINQLNAFAVMHDALKVGGVMFHQLPSLGWRDHGYFCYHATFLRDLAQANGYEVLDQWHTPAGEISLEGLDLRDPLRPGEPGSAVLAPGDLRMGSFNLNFVVRKRVSAPFAVALELATSHSAPDSGVLGRYAARVVTSGVSLHASADPVQEEVARMEAAAGAPVVSGPERILHAAPPGDLLYFGSRAGALAQRLATAVMQRDARGRVLLHETGEAPDGLADDGVTRDMAARLLRMSGPLHETLGALVPAKACVVCLEGLGADALRRVLHALLRADALQDGGLLVFTGEADAVRDALSDFLGRQSRYAAEAVSLDGSTVALGRAVTIHRLRQAPTEEF